nr:hypothetical protein [Acaryochloris sp. IP29b_bin.148]
MNTKYSNPIYTDNEIIFTFVTSFIQGKPILLSNQNLRTEPLFDTVQLIAQQGGVISTAALKGSPSTAKLHPIAPYSQLVHQVMTENSYYPLAKNEREDCYIYQYFAPSKYYKVYCTTAKELWRVCWGRGKSIRSGIPLELVIWGQRPPLQKQIWHPIRGMEVENCQFTVKILSGNFQYAGDDLVVWARKLSSSELLNVKR